MVVSALCVVGIETHKYEVPGTGFLTNTVSELCFQANARRACGADGIFATSGYVSAITAGPSVRLFSIVWKVQDANHILCLFCFHDDLAFSRYVQLGESCSKRTLLAIEWQHQCSMYLYQQVNASFANSSAALFAFVKVSDGFESVARIKCHCHICDAFSQSRKSASLFQ